MSTVFVQDVIDRLKKATGYETEGLVLKGWGITQQYISRIKGKRVKVPKPSELRAFCDREGINYNWVITGDGEMKTGARGGDHIATECDKYLADLNSKMDALLRIIGEQALKIGRFDEGFLKIEREINSLKSGEIEIGRTPKRNAK